MTKQPPLRRFHAPVWNEPIIMELGRKGERGILVPEADAAIQSVIGNPESYVPTSMRRTHLPNLPELSQPQILRHYLRLSQQTLGMELNISLGEGTCTMKYSPKVNEELAGQLADVHPLQDEETLQGILEIVYRFANDYLHEISGLDAFSFQAGGGSAAQFANACIIRKYHEQKGELEQRNEIITTIFSHPCDAGTPATAGFKVITLYPEEETGYPSIDALKAAVSNRTAGLMITNPEDTGIFNPEVDEWTKIVHEAGGLCAYDQANANAILGVTRAKDAGFDLCFFNLHKTFSSPHGSHGPGCGAIGVTNELAKYLPVPMVTFDGNKYHLDYDRPHSIGMVQDFIGNVQVVVRAYAWVLSMGAEGLREVAEISMLNNNYLEKKLLAIPDVTKPYGGRRVDQIRFSLAKLKEATGVGTADVRRRMVDFGIQGFFMSHHPWIVEEPFTPEPCETYSKADLDYWAAVLHHIIGNEAYNTPDLVKNAPHQSSVTKIDTTRFDDPDKWAMTWRAYQRKKSGNK